MIALLASLALFVQDTPPPEDDASADEEVLNMMNELFRQSEEAQRNLEAQGFDLPEPEMSADEFSIFMEELMNVGREEEERLAEGQPPRSDDEIRAEAERRMAARMNGNSGSAPARTESVAIVVDPLQPGFEFQTPEERLAERLDALAGADEATAAGLVDEIHALWAHSGSDTISLLMDRGRGAEIAGNEDIAARMYDHVTRLAPDYAEGWLAAGRVAAGFEDWSYALESLNRALTIEPRRYDAYMSVGQVLEAAEAWDAALDAYEEVLAIYPAFQPAVDAKNRLEAAAAGRAL